MKLQNLRDSGLPRLLLKFVKINAKICFFSYKSKLYLEFFTFEVVIRFLSLKSTV